jgi:hypothetical protein
VSALPAAVQQTDLGVLLPLTQAFVSDRLDAKQFQLAGLDGLLLSGVEDFIAGRTTFGAAPMQTVQNLINSPRPLVDDIWKTAIIATADAAARRSIELLHAGKAGEADQATNQLLRSVQILNLFPTSELYGASVDVPLFFTIFEVAFLLPKIYLRLDSASAIASTLWQVMISETTSLGVDDIAVAVAARLGVYVSETTIE